MGFPNPFMGFGFGGGGGGGGVSPLMNQLGLFPMMGGGRDETDETESYSGSRKRGKNVFISLFLIFNFDLFFLPF